MPTLFQGKSFATIVERVQQLVTIRRRCQHFLCRVIGNREHLEYHAHAFLSCLPVDEKDRTPICTRSRRRKATACWHGVSCQSFASRRSNLQTERFLWPSMM